MRHLLCDRGQTPERLLVPENLFEAEQLCRWFGSIAFPGLRCCFRAEHSAFSETLAWIRTIS